MSGNPTPLTPGPDDELARLLRAALTRAADQVEPDPASWQRLRDAIADDRSASGRFGRPSRPSRFGQFSRFGPSRAQRWMPVAAAAAVALAAGGILTTVRSNREAAALQAAQAAMTAATPETLGAAAAAQPGSGPVAPKVIEPLPVYYIAEQSGRQALVREFEPTTITDPQQRLEKAVALAVAGDALDPDHTSAWRMLHLTGQPTVSATTDRIVVTLPHSLVGAGTGRIRAGLSSLAVHQLVYTATAVSGRMVPVEVRGGTDDRLLFDEAPLGVAAERVAGVGLLAPLWLNSPNQGDSLARGTATFSCETVRLTPGQAPTWSLVRLDSAVKSTTANVIDHGVAVVGTAALPARPSCSIHVTLAQAGHYQLRVTSAPAPEPPIASTPAATAPVTASLPTTTTTISPMTSDAATATAAYSSQLNLSVIGSYAALNSVTVDELGWTETRDFVVR